MSGCHRVRIPFACRLHMEIRQKPEITEERVGSKTRFLRVTSRRICLIYLGRFASDKMESSGKSEKSVPLLLGDYAQELPILESNAAYWSGGRGGAGETKDRTRSSHR